MFSDLDIIVKAADTASSMTDGRHLLVRSDEEWETEIREDTALYEQARQVADGLYRRRNRTIQEALLAGYSQANAHRASGLSRGRIGQLSVQRIR